MRKQNKEFDMRKQNTAGGHIVRTLPVMFFVGVLASAFPAFADTQTFCVTGDSDGAGWSWSIIVGESGVAQATGVGPIVQAPPTPDCELSVAAFVASINDNSGVSGCSAAVSADDKCCFTITCDQDFEFWVGDATGTPTSGCKVTGNPAGCEFNPLIYELTDVPTVNEWGLIVTTLLLLTAGTVVIARRRRAAA